ncbi:MAG: aminotransferase class V-fold PLP-dependent enzyme [Mycobacterium leprae]
MSLQDLFLEMHSHFPALEAENCDGHILFDNAAGAQLPRMAIERVTAHLLRHNAQKGTVFAREESMQQGIYDLRAACADLMGTDSSRVALGLNATSLTALIAHQLGRDLHRGDLVLTSELDHMANIRPWEEMRTQGIRVESIPISPDGTLDLGAYQRLLTQEPKVVACGWVSNATGTPNDLSLLAKLAHTHGALFFADCTAGAPHLLMSVEDWEIDFAVCSAYKIFGPHLGFCYINPARLGSWQLGELISQEAGHYGYGSSYGARLELGTQNHEGVAGFTATLEYLAMLGTKAAQMQGTQSANRREQLASAMNSIHQYEIELTAALRKTILDLPNVVLYGAPEVPIISFNLSGREPKAVAQFLMSQKIEARVGHFLAIPQMNRLAPSHGGEALRVSLVHYNLPEEIERFGAAMRSFQG